ncbi:MAG: hypothetical protein IT438_10780 [Phycisphaerales bacterium]|nr:hypothetical protein [Phycisphaerales bacterium]
MFNNATLYADGGCDSNGWHHRCWEDWGAMSDAPPVVRSRVGQVGGKCRRVMKQGWPGYAGDRTSRRSTAR